MTNTAKRSLAKAKLFLRLLMFSTTINVSGKVTGIFFNLLSSLVKAKKLGGPIYETRSRH